MSAASVLDVQQNTDKKGKKYYKFELLSRTGQCHSLLAASTVSWLVWYNALQLLCQQLACRNVFGNLLQRPGSQVILHSVPCQQQRDGEEASQPAVCGALCGSLLGAFACSAASSAADRRHHPAARGLLL